MGEKFKEASWGNVTVRYMPSVFTRAEVEKAIAYVQGFRRNATDNLPDGVFVLLAYAPGLKSSAGEGKMVVAGQIIRDGLLSISIYNRSDKENINTLFDTLGQFFQSEYWKYDPEARRLIEEKRGIKFSPRD